MKTEQPPTRKKNKIYQSPTVKIQPLPKSFGGNSSKSILQEQKDRFLRHGKTPMFVVQGDTSTVDDLASKTSGKIRFDLFGEAQHILHTVKQQYGVGENYLEHIYGPRIDQDEANQILFDYIKENSLQESLSVYWSNDLNCSARLVWKGYSFKCNRPEMRRYYLWLNGTSENPYLRRHGLRCLLDHEIGTHFYRNFNDGLQPWFSDRKKFGLRSAGSFESLCTEEGLAAVNTTLRAKEKYLWLSALVYYTACKSTEMTFKQLFDHLGQFLDSPEQRWKHVMRVKRGLVDPNDLGGYGKDQCYFEGAIAILRNLDDINFQLLMSGKICYDEVDRVKRLARTGSIVLPFIMRNMNDYRKQLKRMAMVNGLHIPHPRYMPTRDYLQRLQEREAGHVQRRKVRKRKKHRASLPVSNQSSSTGSDTGGSQLAASEGKADALNDLDDEGQPRRRRRQFETVESLASFSDTLVKGKRSQDTGNRSSSICVKHLSEEENWPPPGESSRLYHSPGTAASEKGKGQEGQVSTKEEPPSATFPSVSSCDEISRGPCARIENTTQLKSDVVSLNLTARPKTAGQVSFAHLSVLQTLGTKGKIEITRVERIKTAENEASCSIDMQCDGSLCMSAFRTKRSWESPQPSVNPWLLTLASTPSEQVQYASETS